ncbi:MAG: sulfurtransferase TusA family protein [Marinomonas sp.]|uniref:sulfurtransferase TusA family protein n=1 Tax=Marinomonas sp. GJ51-6 TaxID=2992802 RepID=UPI0029347B2E|nr:sulfurtransferase TusA family protein [Marinomonas sp. GJ51-6]WOD07422.1 sulfurtransferase TusA family protein [Marinomonas sp. GJ51-6]
MANHQSIQYDVILDAREDRCPMPLLKTKLSLSKMEKGGRLLVQASDPGSMKDIPHYIELVGFSLLSVSEEDDVYTFLIQKN